MRLLAQHAAHGSKLQVQSCVKGRVEGRCQSGLTVCQAAGQGVLNSCLNSFPDKGLQLGPGEHNLFGTVCRPGRLLCRGRLCPGSDLRRPVLLCLFLLRLCLPGLFLADCHGGQLVGLHGPLALMAFACPDFVDQCRSGALDPAGVCVSCGGCAALLRAGRPAGCIVRDREVYKL